MSSKLQVCRLPVAFSDTRTTEHESQFLSSEADAPCASGQHRLSPAVAELAASRLHVERLKCDTMVAKSEA